MKILIVRNWPTYMSVKNNTYNIQELGLAKALVRKGHECDILFWTDRKEEDVLVEVSGYGKINVYYRHGIVFLKNVIFNSCAKLFNLYDIIQSSEYNQLQSFLLAKRYPSKTIIYHGPYFSSFNKKYNCICRVFDMFFLKGYIKRKTPFIVKSELAKEFLISKKINKDVVKTIGVGIDVDMLNNNINESVPICNVIKNDRDDFKILYVGRFEKRRDIFFLLDVVKAIYIQRPNIRLYLIGTGNKQYLEQVFNYAREIGIDSVIYWQESIEQKNLGAIYECADVFLLPTEYEIFGMVLLEAMYYKTAVITTLNGGSSTLIKDRVNGFVISKNDKQEWVRCLIELIDNKSLLEKVKNNAYRTISNYYTWDMLVDNFIKMYEGLLL